MSGHWRRRRRRKRKRRRRDSMVGGDGGDCNVQVKEVIIVYLCGNLKVLILSSAGAGAAWRVLCPLTELCNSRGGGNGSKYNRKGRSVIVVGMFAV